MPPEPRLAASRDPTTSATDPADEPAKLEPSILEKVFVWVAVGFVVITSVWIAIRLITHG
jgi:hypothetical protein